jgi:hypothetical protein
MASISERKIVYDDSESGDEVMNLRRGTPRLWALVSAIWIVFWSWQRNILCEFNLPYFDSGPWCLYQSLDMAFHAETVAILLGPPILVGLIGWVVAGFKPEHDL